VRIFIFGTIIVALSSIITALAVSSAMMITLRLIQGIGSAMMFGTNMAIVTSSFPPEQRGKAIGINVTAVYLGLSLAPFLGGIMTQALGWQSIFYITGPIVLTVGILALIILKPGRTDYHASAFDYKGSLIYIASMSGLMYGLSKLPDLYAIGLAVAGTAGLIFFASVELKTTMPVFNMRLFMYNRLFALSNLAALINYATTFAITFILSLYLQYAKGLSPREAGLVLVVQPILMAITASFSGRLSDRYPPHILASSGMGIIAAGLVMLMMIDAATSNGYLIGSLVVLGIGFGLFSSPNTNSIMSSVERKDLGIASATVATMRLTGQMVSMAIATLVIHIMIGKAPITATNKDAFLHTIPLTFAIFIILSLVGIWASLMRNKVRG
jgi:MFS family permease